MTEESFRLGYLPGVTPAKWAGIWRDRWADRPLDLRMLTRAEGWHALATAQVDALLGRLPVPDPRFWHAIVLYEERSVVVVPQDHVVTAADSVVLADLAQETLLAPLDDPLDWTRAEGRPGEPARERPATTGDAVELVAAGAGLVVVPQSLARLHHRKDLTYREVTDAPRSTVGLIWPRVKAHDRIEDMIGVVRGRTANSTRGGVTPQAAQREGEAQREAKAKRDARTQHGAGKDRAGHGRTAGGRKAGGQGATGKGQGRRGR